MNNDRYDTRPRWALDRAGFLAVGLMVVMTLAVSSGATAQIAHVPESGRQRTAYTLGRGGFMVGGGYMTLETRLPRPNQPPITQRLNVGGLETEREVSYRGEGGLLPLMLGFGVGEATDLYLTATLSNGTREKRVKNFYGVPEDVYRDAGVQYDRVYDQPLFDLGLGLKYQLKPDLGDGFPAVAAGISGRFGYTADDFENFKDSTPADGLSDVGLDAYVAVSEQIGEMLALHGSVGVNVSRKLGPQTVAAVGGEFALIPQQLFVSADFSTRRDVAGIEYDTTGDRLTVALRYQLSSRMAVQMLASPEGHLLVQFIGLGERAETVKPRAPALDQGMY